MINDEAGIDILLKIYLVIWIIIALSIIWFNIRFKKKPTKYRVGKKQGRAILEVETGKEYLTFPQGKEDLAKCFCEWLNTSVYRETSMKRQVLDLLKDSLKNAIKERGKAKIDMEYYWLGIETELSELINTIKKEEFYI